MSAVAIRAVVAVVVLALASACRSSASDAGAESDVENTVRAAVAAIERRDEPAVRRAFVEDDRLRWYTDGALAYASVDAMLASMASYGSVRFATELEDVEVVVLARKSAAASAAFTTELSGPGVDDVRYGGVLTWVLEHDDATDTWRIVRGHTSTPGGPPGAEANVEDTSSAVDPSSSP
ncbi:MAG: nuclear transport factor 2 family protein [Planctomycetota bacterium]